MPDPTTLQGSVDEYMAMRAREDDFTTRALGCWGLVARWPDSRDAVASLLRSTDEEEVEDAAGVLGRVGLPADMLPTVLDLIEALSDSTTRDCLVQALPLGHPRRAPEAVVPGDALEALAGVPLRGGWEPYTGRIQFLDASFDAATKQFTRWMRRPSPVHPIPPSFLHVGLLGRLRLWTQRVHREYAMTQHTGSLATVLPLLDPYWWPVKRVFVETHSGWTAVFSNGHETYEASELSRQMRVRAVETDFSPDVVVKGEVLNYGGTSFEMFEKGEAVRTVHVTRQASGWDFILLGQQLPFEEVDRYEARVKRERFDLGMLNRYCAALGIHRADHRFYGPRAMLHTEGGAVPQQHPLYRTAAEWRAANLPPPGTN